MFKGLNNSHIYFFMVWPQMLELPDFISTTFLFAERLPKSAGLVMFREFHQMALTGHMILSHQMEKGKGITTNCKMSGSKLCVDQLCVDALNGWMAIGTLFFGMMVPSVLLITCPFLSLSSAFGDLEYSTLFFA
jgi:hypothetical protein